MAERKERTGVVVDARPRNPGARSSTGIERGRTTVVAKKTQTER